MSLKTNSQLLLAGLEGTVNVDPGLTPSLNAIPADKFIPSYSFQELQRLVVNSGIDAAKKLIGRENIGFNFEVELIASGQVGVAPFWGKLLKACGFTETILAAAAIDDPIAGFGNTGLTGLTVLSEGTFTGAEPRVYKIEVTTGGASEAAEVSITCRGDVTQSSTGNTVTTATPITLGDEGASITFTFASGDLTMGDVWYVHAYPIGIRYKPTAADATFGSEFFYHYLGGLLFKGGGASGNATLKATAGEIASLSFDFQSVFASIADVAVPDHTFSDDVPAIVESSNFNIDNFDDLIIENVSIETNNSITEKRDVNSPRGIHSYRITERDNQFAIDPEAKLEADFDFWNKLRARSEIPMSFKVGSTPGNIVHVQVRRGVFDNLSPTDSDNDLRYGITGQCRPSPAKNDNIEFFVC